MKQTNKYKEILATALRDFDRIQSVLHEPREECLSDRRFYSVTGAQWEGNLEKQFENKPMFEINKVHLAVIKVFNEYRNNRVSVDFISKDGSKDDKLADICDGLFKADEQDSRAEEAYDNAFEEAVGGGFGAFRLTTEYEDEEDEEDERQRIRIEPIYDADSCVFFDLDAKRQDKSDAKYGYVMYSITPEEYKEEYGEEAPTTMDRSISNTEYDWFAPDVVYIAEYYRVETEKETVYVYKNLTGDEERYTDKDFEDDEDLERKLEAVGTVEVRRKKVKRRKIRKYIISGDKVLEDCGYIAGKNIPIIPVFGKRWYVDSVERCMGHVRLVKDAQRLKNMLTSKLAEIAALSAVEKPIVTPEQIKGHEDTWANDNIENYAYLPLNPITDAVGQEQSMGPVGYSKPPSIPPALAALLQLVDIDIKELLGNSTDADKMLSHVSGKAHEMVQKRIDGQAYIYMSNFAKAVQRTGEVYLSMAKEVYVENGRKMKVVDKLGESSQVELQIPGVGADGVVTEVNDLTKASFDVTASVGPSSSSQREASVQTLIGMMQVSQNAEDAEVLQAMALMNMEGDGISETREYFRKKLVTKGVIKPTEEEAAQMAEAAKNAEPSPEEQLYLATAEKEKANAQKAQADTQKTGAEIEKTKAQTAEIYSDMGINKVKVKLDMMQNSRNAVQQGQNMGQQNRNMLQQ